MATFTCALSSLGQKTECGGYAKAQAIKEALQQVQLLVVCDFDVAIMDATQPIESILAGWGFTHTQLVMAAEDPDRLSNKWPEQ